MIDREANFLTKSWLMIAALVAPLLAWMVEQQWPYPHIVEEVLKMGIVLGLKQKTDGKKLRWWSMLMGLLFALSETMLYILVSNQSGNPAVLIWRLLLTVPMHMLTILAISTGLLKKSGYAGLTAAIVIHWVFNWLVF